MLQEISRRVTYAQSTEQQKNLAEAIESLVAASIAVGLKDIPVPENWQVTEGKKNNKEICFGPFTYDSSKYSLKKDDQKVNLGTKEYTILRTLAINLGEVVRHQTLINAAFKDESYGDPNGSLKKCIQKLRNKLGDTKGKDGEFELIRTFRRRGYMLVDVSSNASS